MSMRSSKVKGPEEPFAMAEATADFKKSISYGSVFMSRFGGEWFNLRVGYPDQMSPSAALDLMGNLAYQFIYQCDFP